MVTLNKIYTRGGDDGTTALADGSRLPKGDVRIAAYGAVDEANATLGIVRLHTTAPTHKNLDEILARLQNDFFDLGADLSTPLTQADALRIVPQQIDRLEAEIDEMNATLAPLRSFIIPGGGAAAAYLHLARTTIRRAERVASTLSDDEISPLARQYINRASDLLFVAGRVANALDNQPDILWQPAQNR